VQGLYDEDLASHIAPKPSVVSREGQGEASAGDRAGRLLSRESAFPDADRVANLEGHTTRRAIASGGPVRHGPGPAWSETPACVNTRCPGAGRSRL
jgi:hypothetical protein